MKCPSIRLACALGVVSFVLAISPATSVGQTAPRRHAAAAPPAVSTGDTAKKYKAIWEPMNYPDDVSLEDVFFANDKVGWIAGKGTGGFILHTGDGGQHWEVQLGDPHSNNADVRALQFLDAVHGWAAQGGQLIRTTDGKSWETVGPFPTKGPLAMYLFTSVQDGFAVAGYFSGSTIFATHNGGRAWTPAYDCQVTLQVNGLSRNTSCFLRAVYFPSAKVGYAVGGGFNDAWATFVKTVDGGATWKVIFASTEVDTASAVFFTDENNGVVRLRDKRVLITADGGQTWRGAAGTAYAVIKFADPEVGWSCLEEYGPSCSITSDGGKTWSTHDFSLPSDIEGYSVARRDQVIVVGDHGMIYRYRIVPASYTAQGIVDAPLVPAYGEALNDELDHMRAHCKEIQTKLASATSAIDPADQAPYRDASLYGHLQNAALVSYDPEPQGFTQDTSSPEALNGPASPVMQNCCATQLQNLQTSVGSFSQQVPTFSGQFRNLNLFFVGLNMLSDLLNKAHSIQAAFLALKQAPDAQTANTALQNLTGQVEGTSQTLVSGFQNLTLNDTATGALNGAINNMAGSAVSSPTGATQNSAAAQGTSSTAPGSSPTGSTTSNAVDNVAQKAKQKLKKVLPF
jgi:hypothetical protein